MWPSKKKKKYKITLTVSCSLRWLNNCQPVTAKKKKEEKDRWFVLMPIWTVELHTQYRKLSGLFLTRPALCHCLQGSRTRTWTLEAGGNKSCWNAQHRIERFNSLGEQICKFIGKNRKGLRKYKNTQMKTATITTSIMVQRREEDQDCDAKEKKN